MTARKASIDRNREGEIMMLKRTKTEYDHAPLKIT